MLNFLRLASLTLRAAGRDRSDLVLENLLLRHQLAVLTRPTRARRRVRFRRLDKLLWVFVRRLRRDWRRHLVRFRHIVTGAGLPTSSPLRLPRAGAVTAGDTR